MARAQSNNLEKIEQKRHRNHLKVGKQKLRDELLAAQEKERTKRQAARRTEHHFYERTEKEDQQLNKKTIDNTERTMHHAHMNDKNKKPDFSIRDLDPPRANHYRTGGNRRGTQMLEKYGTGFTAITGLSALHNFDELDASHSAEHGTIEGVAALTCYREPPLQRGSKCRMHTTVNKGIRQPHTARF